MILKKIYLYHIKKYICKYFLQTNFLFCLFQNELREGSNEEEEEDDYQENNDNNSDNKMGLSPNGLQIHITSDSVDLDESRQNT